MPTAIVTGGSSGIGKATSVAFAQAGYDVGITYLHNEQGVEEVLEEIRAEGRTAAAEQLDLTEPERGPGVIQSLVDGLGGCDAFVNNAGSGHDDGFLELSLKDWQSVIDIDLTGAFLCCQAAAKHMVESNTQGSITNVTSIHEHVPLSNSSAYCAAKGGLGLLTKVMAVELAEKGIRVNSVAPGEIATKMTGAEDTDPQTEERDMIPVGRPGHAREIADTVVFVASPQASYLTGASLIVDGGLTLMSAVANQRSQ